jgi:hypothetical protein
MEPAKLCPSSEHVGPSLLLGEHLPPVRKIWRLSGAQVIMISVMVAPLIILAAAAMTAALIAWGIKRVGHGGGVLSQSNAA